MRLFLYSLSLQKEKGFFKKYLKISFDFYPLNGRRKKNLFLKNHLESNI
jgi:hypothetical protein